MLTGFYLIIIGNLYTSIQNNKSLKRVNLVFNVTMIQGKVLEQKIEDAIEKQDASAAAEGQQQQKVLY